MGEPARSAQPSSDPQGREAEIARIDPLVRLDGVSVRQGRSALLRDVSLTLRPGEIVTIVGPNGGGKTTLLRAVIGDLKPSGGAVTRRPGLRIGYVPQLLALDRTLPLTAARFVGLAGGVDRAAAAAALDRVGALAVAERQMADLSGGERQRALLARAIARRPELLILDEPTQGLDQNGAARFYALIDRIRREEGAAVLMVSHELHVVMAASDQVVCVNGHVCCQGAPEDVSKHPEYQRLFGGDGSGALAPYRHRHDHAH